MNIHEYQAKTLFAQHHIPVPKGYSAKSPIEAEFAFRRLKTNLAAVKAQIHAGGRGKAGGVKLAKTPQECFDIAQDLLGKTLVTPQTGPSGKKVNTLYIEAGTEIVKEYYLAILVDRETSSLAIMFSTEGGMNIEEVADQTPEKIVTVNIDPTIGLQSHHIRQLCFTMQLPPEEAKELKIFIHKLLPFFCRYDCSLVEINPLVVNTKQQLIALDSKITIDDNALYRQANIEPLRDFSEEDPREIEASKHGLSYIGLDGNIGCLVNGAGLAMATMDIIKLHGGDPANFLDVGGGATEEMVRHAFSLILQDKHVAGIFVNIFGGIMKCDVIANGIVAASKQLNLKIPLVVRLEGTNVEKGQEILKQSSLKIIAAHDMADGAKKILQAIS